VDENDRVSGDGFGMSLGNWAVRGREGRGVRPSVSGKRSTVLTVVIDLSGSYAQFMQEKDVRIASCRVRFSGFYRDRMGSDDRLIIRADLGDDDGNPLRRPPTQPQAEYPTSQAFNTFLASKSNPAGACP